MFDEKFESFLFLKSISNFKSNKYSYITKKEQHLLPNRTEMHPVVIETMNDILNQVETREWKRVTQQRDVLLRRNKRQSKQIQSMEDDWAVATEKLGQENSDLHNEIKRLKSKSYGSLQSERKIFAEREKIFRDEIEKLKEEIEKLKLENGVMKGKMRNLQRSEGALKDILSY